MRKLFLLMFFLVASGRAQQPSATTITVGLFATGTIHNLTVTPLGTNAWLENCATCRRTTLSAQQHFDHITHPVYLSGNLRIQAEGDAHEIQAAGLYTIDPRPGGLAVTLKLPSERYVAAVLSAEAAPDEPVASLEALAITARTFAMANLHRHATDGFDLCDSTHCQALRLGPVSPAITEAVRNTAGITLWSGSRRASIYFTQHCGGVSEDVSALWPTEHASYLTSHADPYCLRRRPALWETQIPVTDLLRIASEQHWNLPTPISNVRIAQHTASGRAKLLEISSPTHTVQISASSLRFAINRTLGWNRIRSDLYTVTITDGMVQFMGHGYGHGVGLCQAGAFQMAIEHHTAAEILAFYFPSAHIGLTSSGGVWHEQTIRSITLRTTSPDPQLTQAAQIAWRRALELLPSSSDTPAPTIIVAPTTELFRQLIAGPGYLLAVTRGNQITLQPVPVLKHYGPIESLLLHEFLHARIEAQSTDKAPLWLREGLAEALTDINSQYTPPKSSLAAIEQALANPTSLATSQQAHREAAAIVRTLGQTYSLTVMRQWLHDGVPAQVLETPCGPAT